MAEEEEIFCIHVRVEDQPCHDVTQRLMHLPDYLQLCGALQNLQRQQHESHEGQWSAMCIQKSQEKPEQLLYHLLPKVPSSPIASALLQHPSFF